MSKLGAKKRKSEAQSKKLKQQMDKIIRNISEKQKNKKV